MEIPFVTLKMYDGQVLESAGCPNSMGSDQGVRWLETDDVPSWAFGATEQIFKQRNDQLQKVYKLDYPDINGLGNSIYRLDGSKLRFCLKVLGDAEGNQREPLIWELLGYGESARTSGQTYHPIRGLPPAKFTFLDKQLRTVLTPYYQGVLKAISGGAYEFPLVLCATLFIEETLHHLHAAGLAYMDLCPSNILFTTTPEGSMLFFLTDMGGAKPLAGFADVPAFQELLEALVPRRWTRREVLPPTHLFENEADDPRLEPNPAYDDYTLARTAQVLLGLGSEADTSNLEGLGDELNLEDPMRPLLSEMQLFLKLLQPWLSGRAVSDSERAHIRTELEDLFLSFFHRRADFAAHYLPAQGTGQRWREILLARFCRYRMALAPLDYPRHLEDLEARLSHSGSGLEAELAIFNRLAQTVLDGHSDMGLKLLDAAAKTQLVRISRVANYSFFHHKKLIRAKFAGSMGLSELLERIGAGIEQLQPLAEEPESATTKEVRRDDPALGLLKRVI